MQLSVHTARNLVLATAGLALLAGCTSGNNNNNNNVQATKPPIATTISTARTATPLARVATPNIAVRTPTPAAAVRTATPATAAVRTATPSASAPSDQALQKTLADAALTQSDLPAGFTAAGPAVTDTVLPGQTAGYSVTFTDLTHVPQVQAVLIGLGGFRDAAAAGDQFKNIQQQITNAPGSNFTLQPVSNAPKLGDDSQAFQVSGTSQGIPLGGFAIIWRRGKIAGTLLLVGAPAVTSVDSVTPLAQKQDDKLKAAGQ